mmetsp:Transcript_37670/g.82719  ORF Transcript_37670/g.82719 Transcript_37670/m.82719 type:complete len:250 (+) Transcript_37670:153-902(+)
MRPVVLAALLGPPLPLFPLQLGLRHRVPFCCNSVLPTRLLHLSLGPVGELHLPELGLKTPLRPEFCLTEQLLRSSHLLPQGHHPLLPLVFQARAFDCKSPFCLVEGLFVLCGLQLQHPLTLRLLAGHLLLKTTCFGLQLLELLAMLRLHGRPGARAVLHLLLAPGAGLQESVVRSLPLLLLCPLVTIQGWIAAKCFSRSTVFHDGDAVTLFKLLDRRARCLTLRAALGQQLRDLVSLQAQIVRHRLRRS